MELDGLDVIRASQIVTGQQWRGLVFALSAAPWLWFALSLIVGVLEFGDIHLGHL